MDYAKVSNCILVEISIVFFLLIKKYKSPNELVLFMAHFDTSKLSIPASFFWLDGCFFGCKIFTLVERRMKSRPVGDDASSISDFN